MKLKKFLLLGIFAVLAAFCLTPGFAFADDPEGTALSFTDGYCHPSGGSYYLKEDVDNGAILITGDTAGTLTTIDLNGHWLKQTEKVYRAGSSTDALKGTIYLKASTGYKVNVKIINSKPDSGGIIQNSYGNAIYLERGSDAQAPTLTLNGISVSTSYSKMPDESLECLAVKGGEATIDNSMLQIDPESLKAAICVDPVSSNKVTVNSGIFKGSTKEYAEDIINVNKVTGKTETPSIVLNGGTYNKVPEQATLGEGKFIYQSSTAEYTVSDNHDGYDYAIVPSALGGVWFKDSDSALAYKNTFKKKTFHTVAFVSSNKTAVPDQYVADGCSVAKPLDPSDPKYDGLSFSSWQLDGVDYDFSSKVSSGLTLAAKYSGNVASVNGETYATLQEAINAATSGQMVKLIRSTQENVALDDSSKDITVDLDGNVLINEDNSASTFTVKAGHVTLQNGLVKYLAQEDEGTGLVAIDVDGSSSSSNKPSATIDVDVWSSGYSAVYAQNGSLQINGGTHTLSCSAKIDDSSVLTMDFGDVVINGGTFSTSGGSSSIGTYHSGTVTIYGGSFTSDLKQELNENPYSLQGGQYYVMPSLDYLANGYVLYKPADPDIPDDLKGETSPYSVVSADSDLVKNASAKVEISGKTIYYESAAEAKTYAIAHKDEGAVATIYLTATLDVPTDAVYDGTAKKATASFDYEGASDDGVTAVIEYSNADSKEKLDSAPVNAGSYVAKVTGLSGAEKESYKYELSKNSSSATFAIAKADAEITVAESIEKLFGEEAFNLGASAKTTESLAYSSSNEDVATVDGTGNVTIKAVGETTITVSAAEAANFKAAKKEVELTVSDDPSSIVHAEVEFSQDSWTYNGTQQKPAIRSVTLNGTKLNEGTDFTVTYGENVNAGTEAGSVTLTSAGDYKGSKTVKFDIQKAAATITVPAEPIEKTVGDTDFELGAKASTEVEGGSAVKLAYKSSDDKVATVNDGGQVSAHAAGSATITVSAAENGNYTAETKQVSLTVKAAPSPAPVTTNISAAKVTLSKASFTYNGKAQKPSVKSVVLNGKTLKAGTDYTASVASGKKVGTYAVTINAKGSYTGKATASFVINPKGVTKFKVSKAKKSFKAKWAKSKTERSGVQLKYSTKKSMANAKTVKAKGASAKAKTVKKLKKKTKYYVQARAYKVVNGKTYYSAWSAKKAVKTK
ncbi:MAG: Ig-like domain-containing protein [Coriobacteriia bacterium]|nr:Ig-like domain-containing protein [Coriobacteriia bacterium]